MSLKLSYIPEREEKPRTKGITMVMDKGLGLREAADFVEATGHLVDFVKLGFGTSIVMPEKIVKEKIKIYQQANIKVFFGGTLFEAFLIRNMVDEYRAYVEKYGVDAVEVSDGSVHMEHNNKCEYIQLFAKDYTVLSEVGAKEAGILIAPNRWIKMMQVEIEAGSSFVIAEARESGNVGIYRPSGQAHVNLVKKIVAKVPLEKIIWETPQKSQQTWFIKELGADVNLGNIAPTDLIAMETLRLGLRGDTFFSFLPENLQHLKVSNFEKTSGK